MKISYAVEDIYLYQDDITSLFIVGSRQNATLLKTLTGIASFSKMWYGCAMIILFGVVVAENCDEETKIDLIVIHSVAAVVVILLIIALFEILLRCYNKGENCDEENKNNLIVILSLAVVVVILLIILLFVILRRYYNKRENCDEENKNSLIVILLLAVVVGILLILAVFDILRRYYNKRDTFMESLKQIYIPYGEYWCGDCQYEVTYTDRSNKTMNTVDELLAALFKDPKDKRVLFIGESGSGKSRLFRTMAKKWMDGEILQDEILIYLQLEYLSRDSNILEELAASLRSDNNSVTVDSLRMILQNKRSIVMLDGRSNLDRFHNTTQNNDNTNGLTVKQLLIGKNIDQYKKMKIWITYRNLEDASQDMKESKDKVTIVKLLGFNDLQRQGFFARALSVDENSIKDISETWKFYIQEHFNETLDGRYSSPLIAQLFVSYVLQKDTISHLMTFTKSKWNELEKVGNFDILVCLLEAFFQDKNEYKERAKTFQQKQLVFRRITDDYFQEATLHLWQELNDNDRQLKTLEIYGDCPVRLMEYLPTVTDQLVFHNIHSSENYNDYKSITETAFKKCNTVKFSDQTLHKEHLTTE